MYSHPGERIRYERFKTRNAINMGVCILILVIGCANAKFLNDVYYPLLMVA